MEPWGIVYAPSCGPWDSNLGCALLSPRSTCTVGAFTEFPMLTTVWSHSPSIAMNLVSYTKLILVFMEVGLQSSGRYGLSDVFLFHSHGMSGPCGSFLGM